MACHCRGRSSWRGRLQPLWPGPEPLHPLHIAYQVGQVFTLLHVTHAVNTSWRKQMLMHGTAVLT